MAIFKFRKSGDEQTTAPVQPESIEVMRRRAKHRLIGAAVLVLIGVLGFPMLFDKQPRPISVDIPIEIPDKNKVKPLTIPEPLATQPAKPDLAAVVPPKAEEILANRPILVAPEVPKATVKVEPVLPENTKNLSLPPSKEVEKVAGEKEGRFVVQVGAYSDVARAREVRLKVELVGLKTYTQLVETKDGRRIRVRVGPFADRAEADKAAEKIKKLALPAAILSL
ncbi:MAG: SPOR domain-containing protein [Comamonadaceae bacterium]